MSLTKHLVQKINLVINNINSVFEEVVRRSLGPNGFSPVLVGCTNFPSSSNISYDLKSLLEQSIVWYCPVPKKRTTAESKLTKKFLRLPNNFITKYATPKTNIITCLGGNYCEIGTICSKCYARVKAETKALQDQLFSSEAFKYQYPTKEVAFVYENEDKSKVEKLNKLVVEVPRKRPSWFSDTLLTKVSTK